MFNNARVPKVRKGAKKALTPVKELGSESSSEADDESDDVPKKKKARKSSAPTKEKKVMHHQPMTPFFEKKLRDVVHGKKTPSNPKGRKGYSIEPAGQLPDSNNLGKLFNRKPKDGKRGRSKSKQSKRKRDRRKRRESTSPSSGSGSSSSSSNDDIPSEGLSSDSSHKASSSSPSGDSTSPEDSSSSDMSTDDSSSTISSDSMSSRERRRRKRRSEWKRKDSSRERKRERGKEKRERERAREEKARWERLIKPIPPTKYNGAPNQSAFEMYVMEGTNYVEWGGVPKDQQIPLMGYYLTDRGKEFYLYKVAQNHKGWTLTRFFRELFNYCFPLNFRSLQREKLRKCYQNNRSVAEYVYELDHLFNMVGASSKREKVIKLWDGFNPKMKRELHRERLNMEVHSWRRIVRAAEEIELAELESVPSGNHKPKTDQRPHNSGGGGGGGNSGSGPGGRGNPKFRPSGSNANHQKKPFDSKKPWHNNQGGGSNGTNGTFKPSHGGGNSNNKGKLSGNDKHSKGNSKKTLTDAEKQDYIDKDKCFICGGFKHYARNCPQNNTVKSPNKNRPPGVQMNSLRLGSSLAETTQGLRISSVSFGYPETESEPESDDEPPPLQDVSDTEISDSESEPGEEEETWYDAHSSFDNSSEEEDDDDSDRAVLNYESDDEDVFLRIEDVFGFESLRTRIRPAVENLRDTPSNDEILQQLVSEGVTKWFADEAKTYFGYPESPWSEFFLERRVDPSYCPRMVGNLYAEAAEFILEHHAPYPGDETRWGSTSSHRINVFQLDEKTFEVCDLESEQGPLLLPAELLHNPKFQLASWYAKRRAEEQGLPFKKYTEFQGRHNSAIGDPYKMGIELILAHGDPCYPSSENSDSSCDPFWRFAVRRLKGEERVYRIWDDVEGFARLLPGECLKDPNFDLIGWWTREINESAEERAYELEMELRSDARMRKFWFRRDQRRRWRERRMGDMYARAVEQRLHESQPYPGDEGVNEDASRFSAQSVWDEELGHWDGVRVYDRQRGLTMPFDAKQLRDHKFSPAEWWSAYLSIRYNVPDFEGMDYPGIGDVLARTAKDRLTTFVPNDSGSGIPNDEWYDVYVHHDTPTVYVIEDSCRGFRTQIPRELLANMSFNLPDWYAKRLERAESDLENRLRGPVESEFLPRFFGEPANEFNRELDQWVGFSDSHMHLLCGNLEWELREDTNRVHVLSVAGVHVEPKSVPGLRRTSALVKDVGRLVPQPLVVVVHVNGKPARALLDSGSLGNFMATQLADQLRVKRAYLETPLPLHMAVQSSRSKVLCGTTVDFQYQSIRGTQYFDIANIAGYDIILGTPWMYQHKVRIGLNPATVEIDSPEPLPIEGENVFEIKAQSIRVEERTVEAARAELRDYAEPICKNAAETPLPPLRAINHTIPLIDEDKIYSWRPSRCPAAFRSQWDQKRKDYIASGRWEVTTARNTMPMMLIPKSAKQKDQLRIVVDLRERNANTRKVASPLPNIEEITRRVASFKYRSIIDGKDAYEQIRVIPEHVHRTAVSTPDGTMVSHVTQQGDCNAGATYQALMNHVFAHLIGVCMDVYLDDIVIYSNSLEEHVEHVKMVIDILRKEKLYLNGKKLNFLPDELKLLGRIIDDNGIRMDPEKVDSIAKWKIPTSKELVSGFLGAVGFLADDLPRIRGPAGILHNVTAKSTPFQWTFTEQRAFDEIKEIVQAHRDHSRVPLDYSPDRKPIWLVTDACSASIAGVVSQGDEWKTANISAFYSAKLNSTQQNYAVHELEMLAGVETMLRYRDLLQGVQFTWITDHKGLVHLMKQKNLTGRQARWVEKMSEFDFEIQYVPGTENVLSDALSRIYTNDAPGTVRARSEYTFHDEVDNDHLAAHSITMPLAVGSEAGGSRLRRSPRTRTEREESSKQFAKRMAGRVRFIGPRPAQEGEGTQSTDKPAEKPQELETSSPLAARVEDDTDEERPEKGSTAPGQSSFSGQRLRDFSAQTGQSAQLGGQSGSSLVNVVSRTLGDLEFTSLIRNRYSEDNFFKKILEDPKNFKNFEVLDGLIYLKHSETSRVLCVPRIVVNQRSAQEIVISEAHSILAHLGASKTVDYLRDHVWWKDLVADVRSYCESCHVCKISKPDNQKPYGLLNSLGVPSRPWDIIGVDFVGPLPESKNRDGSFDSIAAIIDHFTSMVHLVPCRTTYTARQVAEMMFEHVYKLHGMPRKIVSDRDSLFTSIFWKRLHELAGTRLGMSSAYHPQTDGATERANRTITQMLRQCVAPDQKDWVSKLPAIEFAINSARSESTGYAPFFLNSGQMPRSMIWNSDLSKEYPAVRVFARQRRLALMAAHDSILESRVKQARSANRRRRPEPFKEGDLVYVSTKNLSFEKGLARKLIPKYIGPYRILKDYDNHSFKIELPPSFLQRGIHPVFHSSLLRVHIPNDDRRFPGRLGSQLKETPEAENQWKIEKIVSHSGAREHAIFEVQWSSGDITWMPYPEISGLPSLTEYLDLVGAKDISNLSKGPKEDPEPDSGEENFQVASIAIDGNLSDFYYSEKDSYISTSDPPKAPLLSIPSHSPSSQSTFEDTSSVSSPISAPTLRCSALSFGMAPFKYREGHGPDICRCCVRLAKSLIEYTYHNDQNERHTARIPALSVNVYLNWNIEARHLRRCPDWSPDSSYYNFAYTFNRCVASHRFVIPVQEGEKIILRHLDFPSPPPEELGVEVHQCTDNEQLLPGYVSIHQSEYDELQRVATNAALRESRFRARATREKAERQAHRSSTGRAAGGFSAYVHPDERARREKKVAASNLFYDPSTAPSLSSSSHAGPSSSKRKSKNRKGKPDETSSESTLTAHLPSVSKDAAPAVGCGAPTHPIDLDASATASVKPATAKSAAVKATVTKPAVAKSAAVESATSGSFDDELNSLRAQNQEGESASRKMDTSSVLIPVIRRFDSCARHIYVPQWYHDHQPSIVSALTGTSIAVANNAWTNPRFAFRSRGCLTARNVLENGLTRFRLVEGDVNGFRLVVGWNDEGDPERAWLSQALSFFHSQGISLEGDLSVYQLVKRCAVLAGDLDGSFPKRQYQCQQPIYLFVHPLPSDFNDDDNDKYTSSLHFWSLYEDGQTQLSPELCFDFGLPVQLKFKDFGSEVFFWNTDAYKRVHEYQLARGFDPTTTDFARHLNSDYIVFQPTKDSDRFEELRGALTTHHSSDHSRIYLCTEHSDRTDGSDNSKYRVCTSCSQIFCTSCGQVLHPASCTRLGKLTTTRQNTETDTGGLPNYHHPEQDLQPKDDPTNHDWAVEEQDSRLVQPFPSFVSPFNSHSLESAHPYEGYQSQAHPADDNVNQEDFHHPYLSENLSGGASLNALNTPATIESNSLSTINPQAEWLIMPRYPPPPDYFNGPPRFSSSSADPANVDNNFTGNTTTSASTEPIVFSSDSGAKTTAGEGVDTTRRTGWPGISQIAPFTAVDAFHSTLMADPLDESLISSSFEDGYANLGNGFGASMMNSFYTEPAHVSSVDTATGIARYVDPTAQGLESGPSHIAPAPSGSTGTIDAVDGYPLSLPMQVNTDTPNSLVQAHRYPSFSPYHAGGSPEGSQEQSQGHTNDPITAPNEQTFSSWNGCDGNGDGGNFARGW